MSLLRKIRRRHKAFVLKRSAQIHVDASISPAGDAEDGDEDEDNDFIVEALEQADEQNCDISIRSPPSHELHQRPFPMEQFSVKTDISVQPSIFISSDSSFGVGHGTQIVDKESHFWLGIVKAVAFLLVTAMVFFVGKLAAVGITFTVAFFCKMFARDQLNSRESFISVEAGQGDNSHESLPSDHEEAGPGDRSNESLPSNPEMVRSDDRATVMKESNDIARIPVSQSSMNSTGHSQMILQAHDQEVLNFAANRDSLLTQRKKLKRLNCIKLPPPDSPLHEAMEESPLSFSNISSEASPRAWFRNAGNSTPTGKGMAASSAEIDKQGKFKPKALLRHLRRKGEPHSAPSSPLKGQPYAAPSPLSHRQKGNNKFCVTSDGSDTDRSAHPTVGVHRKSKFRPASLEKEAPVTDASMGLPDQQSSQTPARWGERTLFPATSTSDEATMLSDDSIAAIQAQEMETFAYKQAGKGSLAVGLYIPPYQAVENMQSEILSATPPSRNGTMKLNSQGRLASTRDLQCKRRGKDQSSQRSVMQGNVTEKAVTSVNQDSQLVAVQKGGEKRRKQGRVGTPWIAMGIVITIAGLFVGRMMAVTSLVFYWYALSFKDRKASEKKR